MHNIRWRPGSQLVTVLAFCLAGCNNQPTGPTPEELLRRKQMRESAQMSRSSTLEDRIAKARDHLSNGNADAAQKELRRLLISHPDNPQVILLSAKAEARAGDKTAAAEMLEAMDADDVDLQVESLWLAAGWLADAHRYDQAITKLERLLELPGDKARAHRMIAGILNDLGRRSEAAAHLRSLARMGQLRGEELLTMHTFGASSFQDDVPPESGLRIKIEPSSLTDARSFWRDGEVEWARDLLEKLGQAFPQSAPIAAFRGRVYADVQNEEKLRQWFESVPPGIERQPDYWHTLGVWLRRRNHHREAVRCLVEALRRDETDRFAYLALANSLRILGEKEASDEATQRYELLTEAAHIARDAVRNGMPQIADERLERVARIMDQLQRPWEALSWRGIIVRTRGGTKEQRDSLASQRETLAASETNTAQDAHERFVVCGLDLDRWPLPPAGEIAALLSIQQQHVASATEIQRPGKILFENQAAARNWLHAGAIAPDAVDEGRWIYQTVGGGVGVVDFDLDGWPDLAAAMLDGQPLRTDSSSNRLYRNLQGRFVEYTTQAGYLDTGFAQGITVGDYNDDGFPDIYDSNIGRNRLFRNNGDGTFQEVSGQVGLRGEFWSTSAVIADIDGDGFPDIFESAYCAGKDPYEVECQNARGISSCMPLKFEAQKDRVWRGAGDGSFTDVTADWMVQKSPGHGLGILAGHFDDQAGLDLYVANDMSGNHLWCGRSTRQNNGDSRFQLTEEAAIRGVGFSGSAVAQASMGMAAGDPDTDGDIDFFLTHFADEHNTYYEQVAPGLWMDRSFQVGLAEPSMKLLGFGAEWVDLDNNGTLELIVTNGHVNNSPVGGVTERMPPQLFQLKADGRWSELDRDSLGDYFNGQYLGRALATVDVDRDGRVDVAITHLFDPVALLVNQSSGAGNSISVELKATGGQRDAIGAKLTATVGQRQVTTQLTAGDGYMCSNQRRIHLGIAAASEAENVTVTWPSGHSESFGTLIAGAEYLIVEGSGQPFQLQGAH